jgi:hypothetical protein
MPTLPNNPIPSDAKSEYGKRANELHAEAREALARIQAAREATAEANRRTDEARRALQEEVTRGALEGQDIDEERALAEEVMRCEIHADPTLAQNRLRTAQAAADQAVDRWRLYVRAHAASIIEDELSEDAEQVSAELVAALTTLAPLRAEYNAIRQRVATIADLIIEAVPIQSPYHGGSTERDIAAARWQLAEEPHAPLPDYQDAILYHGKRTEPERYGHPTESDTDLATTPAFTNVPVGHA